jgi:hypothetical protein
MNLGFSQRERNRFPEKRLVPSSALLSAALYGLTALGCGSSDDEPKAKAAGTSEGVITSKTTDPDMTLEKFTALCNARSGVVEIHPHCGGANTCKGMSYDDATHEFTEHTCMGLNTCSGYSCVVPS